MGTREVYEEKLRRGNLHHDPTIKPGLGSARCPRCLSLVSPSKVEDFEWKISSVLHDATAAGTDMTREMLLQHRAGGIIVTHMYGRAWIESFWLVLNRTSHHIESNVGTVLGGMLSAVSGFNRGIPYVQTPLKGRKGLPLLVGLPPLVMYAAASAAFGAYALPQFAQLSVTSYYAASSASHYGISLITRHIEEDHASRTQRKELN